MNRQGHVALGVMVASIMLLLKPDDSLLISGAYVAGAGIGSLLPDLDHKTGTLSNLIQFSTGKRKTLKMIGALLMLVGGLCWLLEEQAWSLFAIIGGGLALILSRLRNVVLVGLGLLFIYLFQTEGNWLYAVFAVVFFILPFVKHRGIIHSPELAVLLTVLVIIEPVSSPWLAAILSGGLVGWWSHLVGDMLGREGISSFLLPKLHVALRLLVNGSRLERWGAGVCWACSVMLWCWLAIEVKPAIL